MSEEERGQIRIIFLLFFICYVSFVSTQNTQPTCVTTYTLKQVPEDEALQSSIYNFTCNDSDPGENGSLSCNILSGNTENLFAVEENGGNCHVKLIGTLDFDYGTRNFNFNIRISDNGTIPLYIDVILDVAVTSVNDEDPQLFGSPYNIHVTENATVGSLLTQVILLDMDVDIHYEPQRTKVVILPGPDADKFYIDPTTGEVYLRQNLDFETTLSITLSLEILDLDSDTQRTANGTLQLNIEDVNDNAPSCTQPSPSLVIIPESQQVNLVLLTATCTDMEDGTSLNFSIQSGDPFSKFAMEGNDLKLASEIDADTENPWYELTVVVSDQGPPSLMSTIVIAVFVVNVNDNVPEWNQPEAGNYVVSLPETSPVGTTVTVINASDVDHGIQTSDKIIYSIPTTNSLFGMESDTGRIYLNKQLDRESQASHVISVTAHSTENATEIIAGSVTVTVTDANDEAPRFGKQTYTLTISEDYLINTGILMVVASDPDESTNGQIVYSIASGTSPTGCPFTINETSGELTLTSSLDFEVVEICQLVLEASDKGTPSQTGTALVLATITGVNEFTPSFTGLFSVNVTEGTQIGTPLATILGTDSDSGPDGTLVYNTSNYLDTFIIEKDTGIVRLIQQLDRELMAIYEVEVLASDLSSATKKTGTVTLTVYIDDANEHAPNCTISSSVVLPTVSIGNVIHSFDCTDEDEGINGQIVYNIVGGDDNSDFSVDSSGRVNVDKIPSQSIFTLRIEASDSATTPLSTLLILHLEIRKAPVFTNFPVSIDVEESTQPGTIISTIEADVSSGSKSFSLQTGNTAFQIDPQTGKILVISTLDRETTSSYTITVQITDVIFNITTTSSFDIIVLDSNDNAPVFQENFYNKTLAEDTSIGTVLQNLTATDDDIGQNAELVYQIPEGNDENKFSIDSFGMLRLANSLDAELTTSYTLTVLVVDNGTRIQFTGMTSVLIEILNVDEFTPVFLGTGPYSFSVAEDALLFSLLYSIRAEDTDVNSQIFYSLSAGNDETFLIDAATGDLYLGKNLDRETTSFYSLTIDVNSSQVMISTTVDVTVVDHNDNRPIFSQDVYNVTIGEQQPPGVTVVQIACTDADNGTNSMISYSIIGGNYNDSFRMTDTSIEVNKKLHFADYNYYLLLIEAKDQGSPPLSSAVKVAINILPDYKQPKFSTTSEILSLSESLDVGNIVYNAEAIRDGAVEGNLGDLLYEITAGNTDGKFSVDENSGELSLIGKLDRETKDHYDISIVAINKHKSTLRDAVTVTITVTDVNDETPTFSLNKYEFSVDEGLPSNKDVGSILATDDDLSTNSEIEYAIISGEGMSDFVIDATSGLIRVKTILNASTKAKYALTVSARDKGTPSLSSLAVVMITVNDINDQVPTFDPSVINLYVSELVSVGDTIIYYVKAQDTDTGNNGKITYAIQSGNNDLKFTLDPNNGELRTVNILDRETTDFYSLVVTAEDSGFPSNTAQLKININVTDINDNDPAMDKNVYYVTVARTITRGSSCVYINATDPDLDANGEVNFFIIGGDTDNNFMIDKISGEIKTVNNLISASDSYTLEVHAVDGGYPRRTSVVTVEITVDPPQSPIVNNITFGISELANVGDPIGNVSPDNVHAPGATIVYSILSGNINNNLEIGLNDGLLKVKNILDHEEHPRYYLTVRIEDDSIDYNKRVLVSVLDVNDNTPTFDTALNTFKVVENTDINYIVGQVIAKDPDSGLNGEIIHYIDPANVAANDMLNVDAAGTLTIAKSPDFELVSRVAFTLFARDKGSPPKIGSTTVVIDITDVTDDISLSPQSPFYSVECSITAINNDVILTLATDDFGISVTPADTVRFITIHNGAIFGLGESSGEIYVSNKNYLYEDSKYFFWVAVRVQTADNSINGSFAVVRIDTVTPIKHMVTLRHSVSRTVLESQKNALRVALQAIFPAHTRVSILKIRGITTTSRRRLLTEESESDVYVVNDQTADTVDGTESPKEFMSQDAILSVLRESSDGTPAAVLTTPDFASFPVISVSPSTETATQETEYWPSTTAGIAVITIIAVTVFLLAVILITYFACTRERKYNFEKDAKQDKSKASMSTTLNEKKRTSFPRNSISDPKVPAAPTYSETIKEDTDNTTSKSANIRKQPGDDFEKQTNKHQKQTTIKNALEMSSPDEVPGKFFQDGRRSYFQREGSDPSSNRSDGVVTPKNILIESVNSFT